MTALLGDAEEENVVEDALTALQELGVRHEEEAARSGAITHWKVLGPFVFDLRGDRGAFAPYIDEGNVDLNKAHEDQGRTLSWGACVTSEPTGIVTLRRSMSSEDRSVFYAYAEFELPEERDVRVKIGTQIGISCRLNGDRDEKLTLMGGYSPDKDVFEMRGRKGVNTLLLKLVQWGASTDFRVQVSDLSDNPIDLTQDSQ